MVGRKVGKAHVRNLIRRRLREIIRRLEPGVAMVISANQNSAEASYWDLEDDLRSIVASRKRNGRESEATGCVESARDLAADPGPVGQSAGDSSHSGVQNGDLSPSRLEL